MLVKDVHTVLQLEVVQGDRPIYRREFTVITVVRVPVKEEDIEVGTS